jgi:cytochrome c5
MKQLLTLTVIVLVAACAATKTSAPAQADVDRMQSKYPNYTLTDLHKGKTLYESHCGNCHGLKNPSSESETEWTRIVPWMAGKVNEKQPNALNTNDQDLILKYLVTMSAAPKPQQ